MKEVVVFCMDVVGSLLLCVGVRGVAYYESVCNGIRLFVAAIECEMDQS